MLRSNQSQNDFDAELQARLDREIKRLKEQGMTDAEARRAALDRCANVTAEPERYRGPWWSLWLGHFGQDLRIGLRMMLRQRGFTAAAVLTLAIGIGANTAIFSVINAVLLRPFPFVDAGRLTMVWQMDPKAASDEVHVSGPDYLDWRGSKQLFSSISAYSETDDFEMTASEQPQVLRGLRATADLFMTVGTMPRVGRMFTEHEQATGEPVVLIAGAWRRAHFATDADAIGQTLTLNARQFTIIGVLPEGFRLPWVGEFSALAPLQIDSGVLRNRDQHRLHVIARLQPGTTIDHATQGFRLFDATLQPLRSDEDRNLVPSFGALDADNREIRMSLLVLMTAVGFVLLIACANVANLLLARGVGRRKEFAVRCAIGSSRGRLIRQLLTEGSLLGLAGCGLGMVLAALFTPYFARQAGAHFRSVSGIAVDARVAGFAFAVSMLTVVLFSVGPALAASGLDLNLELKASGMQATFRRGQEAVRSALVSGELALALVLLIGASLLLKDFAGRLKVDPGFPAVNVLTAAVHLKGAQYDRGPADTTFYQQAVDRIRAIPGVYAVSAASALPVGQGEIFFTALSIPSANASAKEEQGLVRLIEPSYFDVLGLRVQGREFNSADTAASGPVAIVNHLFVERYFGGQNPIGRSIVVTSKLSYHQDNLRSGPVRIVGVAPDTKHLCIGCEPHIDPEIYVPFAQAPARNMILVARYEPTAVKGLALAIPREVRQIDPNQVIQPVETMYDQLSDAVHPFLFYPSLLSTFAAGALVLACMGVYGVLSYSIAQGTREIGIRIALGATPREIARLVATRSGRLIAVGIIPGIGVSFWLTRYLSHLMHGISAKDPQIFVIVPLLLVAVSALASYVPMRRAQRVDPLVALRSE